VIVSNIGAPGATFEDVRTFKDVCFQHAVSSVAPTFTFTNSPYCEFDNVSVATPFNGSPSVGVWYQTFPGEFERLRINKTILNTSSFEMDGGSLDVVVETDNVIAEGAFLGTGTLRFFLRGSGNNISTVQGPLLDIEVGDGSVFPPQFSGADSITFGAGDTSWAWSGPQTALQLRPGGGMSTTTVADPGAPDDTVGYVLAAGRSISGIVRGIHVQVGGTTTGGIVFDVHVYEGGVLKYQELGFTLAGCVGAGAYQSTNFGELTGSPFGNSLAVWIVPPMSSVGQWDHINVTIFVR